MTDLSFLKSANISLHVIATGAGAGIQSKLWEVPGASAFLSGCSFPYAAEETAEILGFAPERLCSEETAIDLASAAYMRAYRFGGKSPIGIGVTAAVPTDRERRGPDRVHACIITDSEVRVDCMDFARGSMTRAEAGGWCDTLALSLLTSKGGIDATAPALARFFGRPYFSRTGERLPGRPDMKAALMPGAFNPPHEGHHGIAAEVELEHHVPVVFHVTANAPHKPPLTVQELLKRAKLLKGKNTLFTRGEALYIEKARRFPETPIVMGSDALLRMLDPQWGPEVKAMLCEFSQLGTTFFVSPREGVTVDDCFERCSVDCEFRWMFTELKSAFAMSSTKLREKVA